MKVLTPRQQKKLDQEASRQRIEQDQAETRAIVAGGHCPKCNSGLRANLSILGWWQCEQFGSDQFRKRPLNPQCSWQGFTNS